MDNLEVHNFQLENYELNYEKQRSAHGSRAKNYFFNLNYQFQLYSLLYSHLIGSIIITSYFNYYCDLSSLLPIYNVLYLFYSKYVIILNLI